METITDWSALWRELVELKAKSRRVGRGGNADDDPWKNKAFEFRKGVQRRWSSPDSSRDFIISHISPDSTVLDIGAGTGAWSVLLSRHAKRITAVEPSPSMLAVMRDSIAAEKITTVDIIQGSWPDVQVEPHDYTICSHAMYGYPDLASFILRMVACTKRMCFLLLRAPSLDGIRAEAARHIWGQPMDSPNFTIAYNILIQIGIYANVRMENTGLWKARNIQTLEEAVIDMKRYFGLIESDAYDAYLTDLLRRRLKWTDESYVWPPEVRSALVYWDVEEYRYVSLS
jgi:SAM-dependent methyltransferase